MYCSDSNGGGHQQEDDESQGTKATARVSKFLMREEQ